MRDKFAFCSATPRSAGSELLPCSGARANACSLPGRHHEPWRAVPKVAVKTAPSVKKRHPSSSHHQRTSQVCLPPVRVPNPVLAKQAPTWPTSGGLSNTTRCEQVWEPWQSRETLCGTMKSTPLVQNTSDDVTYRVEVVMIMMVLLMQRVQSNDPNT